MKFFNTFVTVAILAFVGVKAHSKEEYAKFKSACLQETKLTPEGLSKFLMGGMKPEDASDPLKCYAKCVMEKAGQMKGGQLDDQAVIKSFDDFPDLSTRKQELAKAVNECKGEKGANDCDTAHKVIMCFKAHNAGEIALNEL